MGYFESVLSSPAPGSPVGQTLTVGDLTMSSGTIGIADHSPLVMPPNPSPTLQSYCNFHNKYWNHHICTICPDCFRNPEMILSHVDFMMKRKDAAQFQPTIPTDKRLLII